MRDLVSEVLKYESGSTKMYRPSGAGYAMLKSRLLELFNEQPLGSPMEYIMEQVVREVFECERADQAYKKRGAESARGITEDDKDKQAKELRNKQTAKAINRARSSNLAEVLENWFHAMWNLDDYNYHDLYKVMEYHSSRSEEDVMQVLKVLERKGTIEREPGSGWRWIPAGKRD